MASQSPQSVTARLPIWSPGTFRSISGDEFTFTEGDLQTIAAGYSPSAFAAPMVKGHPKTDDPAQGWIDGLEWDGEYLWANASQVDPAFADEHRAGRFRKISPRFFLPSEPGNPAPGHYYLRHVGFLGAAAPANKALPMADFAEGEGTVTFADAPDFADLPEPSFAGPAAPAWGFRVLRDLARRFREYVLINNGREAADDLVPEHLIGSLEDAATEPERDQPFTGFADHPNTATEEDAMDEDQQAAFAEQQAELARQQEALAEQQAAFAEQQAQVRRAECAAFAEQLADHGRILPAEQPFVAELLAGIPEESECSFAEGDEQVTVATGERLRSFLSGLPPRVNYDEHGTGRAEAPAAAFAAPAGYRVDPASADLHAKAKAYQAEHNTTFDAALAAVTQ